LRKFKTAGGASIGDAAHYEQIYKGNKQIHHKRLQEITGIPFQQTLFFDNEMGNINSVSLLGVRSVHCPHGMTRDVWESGLSLFE